MKIIAFLNQKGGVGKSTLAINLASFFERGAKKVLVIDADVQHTVFDWSKLSQQKKIDVIALDGESLMQKLSHIPPNTYDYTFIDMPGSLDELAADAIMNVDFIVVPLQASVADLKSTAQLIGWIKVANEAVIKNNPRRGEVEVALLFNRQAPRAVITRRAREAAKGFGVPVFRYAVTERKIFRNSYEDGLSIFEYEPFDSAAEQEIISVGNLLKERLHGE